MKTEKDFLKWQEENADELLELGKLHKKCYEDFTEFMRNQLPTDEEHEIDNLSEHIVVVVISSITLRLGELISCLPDAAVQPTLNIMKRILDTSLLISDINKEED